jgi:hypothetical protein
MSRQSRFQRRRLSRIKTLDKGLALKVRCFGFAV